jgi:hypothetical protein
MSVAKQLRERLLQELLETDNDDMSSLSIEQLTAAVTALALDRIAQDAGYLETLAKWCVHNWHAGKS